MKMSPTRLRLQQLQLLLLFLCSLQRRTHGWECDGPPPPVTDWAGKGEIMEQADMFFDTELCGPDGLQWRCYIANKCLHGANVFDPNSLYSSSNTAIKKHPCPAVFAIQARTNNQWRIVMQAKNVAVRQKLLFKANCLDEFECWAEDNAVIKGRRRRGGFFRYSEVRGRYAERTLMCDFVISSERGQIEINDASKLTGIVTPNEEDEGKGKASVFYRDASTKIREGCDLSIVVRGLPSANDEEEYTPVNIDRHNFTCPETYAMRWRDTEHMVNYKAPFITTAGISCTNRAIKVVENDASRSAQLDVHCARKKCKHCPAPSCSNSNPAECPQLIEFDDFDTCPKLKCPDELQLRFGGKVHSGEAVCNNGKWTMDGNVVENVDCFNETLSCPDARETIRTEHAEKFNFTDKRVACENEKEDIKYTGDKANGRITAIVCNFSAGGEWYEERKDSKFAPEPYKEHKIDCYGPDSTPAAANLLLFTGIGLGVLAAIMGVILVICLMSRQRKKKNAREAALKMAAKGSKSKESKLLSPRSKSTMSRVTSTRSVTGNQKKKTGGKGGKTPEDNTPEERSRPGDRSSIVATAELKRIEEERRKTAAATAALLESSKVEDEPQPVPATGAGSGEVPVEMGKGSASLIPDATQQPEPPMDNAPKLKTLQKKRLKKSRILENTDLTQQATVTVDKTQMPTASTQAVPSMAVSKTQLGGPESDDEPETPMWHNQPAAAAIPADKKEEPPAAAAASDRQKFADLPTAKKKESSKKTKSAKRTTSAEKVVRPNFLVDTSDGLADFSSSKKDKVGSNEEGGGSKESEKDERSKRTQQRAWAQKTSKRVDPTQHLPRAGSDSAEENNN